jgi:hypothetical protein
MTTKSDDKQSYFGELYECSSNVERATLLFITTPKAIKTKEVEIYENVHIF